MVVQAAYTRPSSHLRMKVVGIVMPLTVVTVIER